MQQLAIISGKGGTGKTTIASFLIHLAHNKIFADCDVDAPNLHLLFEGQPRKKEEYRGAKIAKQKTELCTQCGACEATCRFDAITDCKVISSKCEGCGACTLVCPMEAIELAEEVTGELKITDSSKGVFVHSLLYPGAEGSGKLVTEVKKLALTNVTDEQLIIIDGSPGIGCSVIASISGCNHVLIVTEPTMSGLHDLNRAIGVCGYFNIKPMVCINKYDLNSQMAQTIEIECEQQGVKVVGKIAFDTRLANLAEGKYVFNDQIKSMWKKIIENMEEEAK